MADSGLIILIVIILAIIVTACVLLFYCKARPSSLNKWLNKIKNCDGGGDSSPPSPTPTPPSPSPSPTPPSPTPTKCVPKPCTNFCGDDGCGGKCSCSTSQKCVNSTCVSNDIPLCDSSGLGNTSMFADVCQNCRGCVLQNAIPDPNGSMYPVDGTVHCDSCATNPMNTNIDKIGIGTFGHNKFKVVYDALSHNLKAVLDPYANVKCNIALDCSRWDGTGRGDCMSGVCK